MQTVKSSLWGHLVPFVKFQMSRFSKPYSSQTFAYFFNQASRQIWYAILPVLEYIIVTCQYFCGNLPNGKNIYRTLKMKSPQLHCHLIGINRTWFHLVKSQAVSRPFVFLELPGKTYYSQMLGCIQVNSAVELFLSLSSTHSHCRLMCTPWGGPTSSCHEICASTFQHWVCTGIKDQDIAPSRTVITEIQA